MPPSQGMKNSSERLSQPGGSAGSPTSSLATSWPWGWGECLLSCCHDGWVARRGTPEWPNNRWTGAQAALPRTSEAPPTRPKPGSDRPFDPLASLRLAVGQGHHLYSLAVVRAGQGTASDVASGSAVGVPWLPAQLTRPAHPEALLRAFSGSAPPPAPFPAPQSTAGARVSQASQRQLPPVEDGLG